MAQGGKKKLATLVGCNYAGTPNELKGCINDVVAMRDILVARFGFAPGDVAVLTDDRGSPVLPTGANIKRALADMVARAAAGDVLFFHYSGHGTLVPPVKGHHGGCDEAIVPCDFNLITDVDFRRLVDLVPHGASFTMVSDSCHSGGLIDLEKEQIGPSVLSGGAPAAAGADSTPAATRGATARFIPYSAVIDHLRGATARFLPYSAVIDHLSGVSGIDAAHHVAEHLLALFGTDASAMFHHHDHDGKQPARPDDGILLSGCQTDETSADVPEDDEAAAAGGKACGAFSNAIQTVLASHPEPPARPDDGILLSGCQTDETSADGPEDDEAAAGGGKACGAFSNAIQTVLASHPEPVSNRELATMARKVLSDQEFEQHPCLYCSDANAEAPFLWQEEEKTAAAAEPAMSAL
uniref:Peptidase C14 caspase domain-containing protein n=1 Tax=Oryza brachyantha TaxID=4533 RepID=J3NB56_ORYBR